MKWKVLYVFLCRIILKKKMYECKNNFRNVDWDQLWLHCATQQANIWIYLSFIFKTNFPHSKFLIAVYGKFSFSNFKTRDVLWVLWLMFIIFIIISICNCFKIYFKVSFLFLCHPSILNSYEVMHSLVSLHSLLSLLLASVWSFCVYLSFSLIFRWCHFWSLCLCPSCLIYPVSC